MPVTMIAIDGACKGNGKPDCLSVGSYYAIGRAVSVVSEQPSTNQRGEMNALILALTDFQNEDDVRIITDSEYLFNAVTKEWFRNWERKGWLTAMEEPVKNRDLWEKIMELLDSREDAIGIYHIKGHVIPFGAVKAANLLLQDPTGSILYEEVATQYDNLAESKADKINNAAELFSRNHGYELEKATLRQFIINNTVADLIAANAVANLTR